MKMIAATLLAFASLSIAHAQTPAAPQGATGMCKDGSYSTSATKRGACAGHKGVKDWYATDAATATPSAPPSAAAGAPVPAPAPSAATPSSSKSASAPATTSAPASAPAPAATPKTPRTPTVAAAGGGNGQVWVNTSTKVYHCEGDRYYGKTKAGSYTTESAALAAGDRAANGKACKSS